jgi:mRNA-degrading endonuclease toxin of MazEF toxin-antitoxin module
VPLVQGQIVTVETLDPQGRNAKERPVLIITPTACIQGEAEIVAVAVTSTFTKPLDPTEIPLPWHRQGHPRTRLNRECVAKCHWLVRFRPSDVRHQAGVVPQVVLQRILDVVLDSKL